MNHQQKITEVLRGLDSSRMSRRQMMSLAAMAAMAVPLAACGGERTRQAAPAPTSDTGVSAASGDRPGNDTFPYDEAKKLFESLDWPATNVPEPTSKVTVTMAITSSEDAEIRHKQFTEFFRELHPNIEIKHEVTPWDDFLQKYLVAAAGGSLPDLMYSHYSWGQLLIKNNVLKPLDEYIAATPTFNKDDYTAEARTYWEANGRLYGLPTDSAPKLLWYNKDIFGKAGVDVPDKSWTWGRLQELAIEFTQGKGVKKRFGFAQIPGDPFSDITTIYLLPFGARFLSADERTCLIAEPEAHDALRPWIDLQVKHGGTPSKAEREQLLQDEDPFRTNRAAMSVNGLWIMNELIHQEPKDKFDWGLTDMPSGPAGRFAPVVGSAFGMTAKAANPDAAWIVLNAFLSPAGHRFFLQMPPARLSVFEQNLRVIEAPTEVIATAKAAIQEYGTSEGVLRGPATNKVTDAATVVWDKVRLGKTSLRDGLKEITERLTPILKQNG